MIKNIVFDLGGVLIDWDPRYLYRNHFDTDQEMDWFLETICTMDWNVQQDAGRSLDAATQELQLLHPKWADLISLYYGEWERMLRSSIPDSIDILRILKEKNQHNIFALTNWSAETFPIAQKKYEFLSWFDGLVVSGNEKCIKPDPRIYQILLSRYDLHANECLFIDDNKMNVAAALQLGMKGIWFKNPKFLKEQLYEMGVL